VLFGAVGCGKTHCAVAACRPAHFERYQDVVFRPVVELLDELRHFDEARAAMTNLVEADVLLLDDIGGERPTDWTAERLFAVINRRWLDERPIVATTNLPPTARSAPEGYSGLTLDEFLGERAFDRLMGNGAVPVRLSGQSRRR